VNRLPDDEELSGWQSHERAQLLQSLQATPAQRLAWLEEMMLLAQHHRRLTPADLDERSEK
jgi:hypothetical protein